jgi:site-specific DNA recombinase
MASKPKRASRARKTYEFAGYIADIQCGLPLRCQSSGLPTYDYYRDVAKKRRMPCAAGGKLFVRTDLVRQQFSELLKEIQLPGNWQESIRQKVREAAQAAGINQETVEREKERLRLKKSRILMEHEEGYISHEEFRGKIAAINLTLKELESPHINGIRLEEVLSAGERLPGMAALWDVATPEERREMVIRLFEPESLYYDLEQKTIAAIRPKPAFFYILKMLPNVEEHETIKGLLLVKKTLATANHKPVGSAEIIYVYF